MRVALLAAGLRGDVQPLVALGAGLTERGHHVRLVTHREFQPLVEAAGLEYWFIPGGPATLPIADAKTPLQLERVLLKAVGQNMALLMAQTREACAGRDLVMDTVLCHTEAVENLTVPWCTALLGPFMATTAFPAWGFPTLPLGGLYNRLTGLAAYKVLPPLFHWVGAPKALKFPWRRFGPDHPAILPFSPSVIPPPTDWPPYCYVTGYWFWDRGYQPPPHLVTFLQGGLPPVALTFGSLWPFAPGNAVELAVEAAKRAGNRLVVVGGPNEPMPDGVLRLAEVDHGWLFRRMATVVHHGGAGTTAAALRAGVPQVVVPFFGDQPLWAARAHALGVAPAPVPMSHLTRERLGAALTATLADSQMQDRAAELGALVRADRGVEKACGILERWIADRTVQSDRRTGSRGHLRPRGGRA